MFEFVNKKIIPIKLFTFKTKLFANYTYQKYKVKLKNFYIKIPVQYMDYENDSVRFIWDCVSMSCHF